MSETLGLFDDVAKTAAGMSEAIFTEPDDDWTPVVFMENAEGTRATMPIEQFMENDQMKDMLTELIIPQTIQKFGATRVVMVLSVWSSKLPKGVDWRDRPRPSEALDRTEALIVSEYTTEGITRWSSAEIIRHEDSPPTLGEWDESPIDGFEGRFVNPIVDALRRV